MSLLPPRNIQLVQFPGALDGASSLVADGGHMTALRFPSVAAVIKTFSELTEQTKKRHGIGDFSSFSFADMIYMKYVHKSGEA